MVSATTGADDPPENGADPEAGLGAGVLELACWGLACRGRNKGLGCR